LKFRGAFNDEEQYTKHAKYIIRSIDSKHKIWPFEQGKWMPITTNEEYAKDTLEVQQQEEVKKIYNQQETQETQDAKKKVQEVKEREKKLREEVARKTPDTDSLDYYAQQVMKIQQLETWLETMRKRKRDMLKALNAGKEEIERVEKLHPEYSTQINDKINQIKKEIGLEPDDPIDRPSLVQ